MRREGLHVAALGASMVLSVALGCESRTAGPMRGGGGASAASPGGAPAVAPGGAVSMNDGTFAGGRTATLGGAGGALLPSGNGGTTPAGGANAGGGPDAAGRTGFAQAGASSHTDAGAMGDGSAGAASYLLGADITFVQADEASGVTYSDGATRDILTLLRDHGFNAIRLRTFVDPRATDGYDKVQGYGDLSHTVAFGRRIKEAGMTFFLDFHYSDNWADPGKQCIPVRWQGLSLADMARALHDYTKDAVTQLIAGGARPDLIQIGNEITPGMLIHVCDGDGQPVMQGPVNGSVASWPNLATLLKAGIGAVREVDAGIEIVLHIDRCGDKPSDTPGAALAASVDWITKAMAQGVVFDAFAESCYQAFQGDPNSAERTKRGWIDTLSGVAARFPGIEVLAAEYGALEREINDVVYGLPGQRGLGTFYWEPTHETQGNVGHALFATSGNPRKATADLSFYDDMRRAYAPRL